MAAKLLLPVSVENLDLKTPEAAFMIVDEGTTAETNILQLEGDSSQQTPAIDKTDTYNDNEEFNEGMTNEQEAVLEEEMIANALSNYGRSPDGLLRVFLNIELIGRNLTDISSLSEFLYLQNVTLSYNKISDLTPLSCMPHLVNLDVSHNEVTQLLNFKSPTNLKRANFSYNGITAFKNLTEFRTLSSLNLDNNHIAEIEGLQDCDRLTELRIAHNNVTKIQNLRNLHLKILDLSYNNIRKIENIETLSWLQQLLLANNCIRSLKGLQNHSMLETIDLEDNQASNNIIDLTETKYLKDLDSLRDLNLRGNPIQSLPDYRLSMLFKIQWLTMLDHNKALETEKVAAKNMFAPKIESIASSNFVENLMQSYSQSKSLYYSTKTHVDVAYPFIILVGPSGSSKKDLIRRLVQDFPSYAGHCQCSTSRSPFPTEIENKDYQFISKDKFEMQAKLGRFFQSCDIFGHKYGITRNAIERVAKKNLVCLMHTNLQGALTIYRSHFEPYYLLAIPLSYEEHERKLMEKGIYSDSQVSQILISRDNYLAFHLDTPGFFHCVIDTDDIDCAYHQLQSVFQNIVHIDDKQTTTSRRTSKQELTTNGVPTHCFSHQTISESSGTNSTPISYYEPKQLQYDDITGDQKVEEHEAPRPGTRGDYSVAYEKMKQIGIKPQSAPVQWESDDDSEVSEDFFRRLTSAPETIADTEKCFPNLSNYSENGAYLDTNETDLKQQQHAEEQVVPNSEQDNNNINNEMKSWAELLVEQGSTNTFPSEKIIIRQTIENRTDQTTD